jgi:hypothetical protein
VPSNWVEFHHSAIPEGYDVFYPLATAVEQYASLHLFMDPDVNIVHTDDATAIRSYVIPIVERDGDTGYSVALGITGNGTVRAAQLADEVRTAVEQRTAGTWTTANVRISTAADAYLVYARFSDSEGARTAREALAAAVRSSLSSRSLGVTVEERWAVDMEPPPRFPTVRELSSYPSVAIEVDRTLAEQRPAITRFLSATTGISSFRFDDEMLTLTGYPASRSKSPCLTFDDVVTLAQFSRLYHEDPDTNENGGARYVQSLDSSPMYPLADLSPTVPYLPECLVGTRVGNVLTEADHIIKTAGFAVMRPGGYKPSPDPLADPVVHDAVAAFQRVYIGTLSTEVNSLSLSEPYDRAFSSLLNRYGGDPAAMTAEQLAECTVELNAMDRYPETAAASRRYNTVLARQIQIVAGEAAVLGIALERVSGIDVQGGAEEYRKRTQEFLQSTDDVHALSRVVEAFRFLYSQVTFISPNSHAVLDDAAETDLMTDGMPNIAMPHLRRLVLFSYHRPPGAISGRLWFYPRDSVVKSNNESRWFVARVSARVGYEEYDSAAAHDSRFDPYTDWLFDHINGHFAAYGELHPQISLTNAYYGYLKMFAVLRSEGVVLVPGDVSAENVPMPSRYPAEFYVSEHRDDDARMTVNGCDLAVSARTYQPRPTYAWNPVESLSEFMEHRGMGVTPTSDVLNSYAIYIKNLDVTRWVQYSPGNRAGEEDLAFARYVRDQKTALEAIRVIGNPGLPTQSRTRAADVIWRILNTDHVQRLVIGPIEIGKANQRNHIPPCRIF